MAFAVEAAVGLVGNEMGVIKLIGIDGHKTNAKILRDFSRPFQDMLWFGDACAYARDNIIAAQRIDRRLQQKCAIHPAGIGDNYLAQFFKDCFQGVVFIFYAHD